MLRRSEGRNYQEPILHKGIHSLFCIGIIKTKNKFKIVMAQYIDKSAVIAEIDRELESISNASTNFALGRKMELANILSFLDTLEVKEVDLEKEFDNYAKDILACDVQFEPFTHLYNCAKHFFELGLKAQKGE